MITRKDKKLTGGMSAAVSAAKAATNASHNVHTRKLMDEAEGKPRGIAAVTEKARKVAEEAKEDND